MCLTASIAQTAMLVGGMAIFALLCQPQRRGVFFVLQVLRHLQYRVQHHVGFVGHARRFAGFAGDNVLGQRHQVADLGISRQQVAASVDRLQVQFGLLYTRHMCSPTAVGVWPLV